MTMPPRDAPRCPRCGILLPMHLVECPMLPKEKPETEPSGLDAVSRPPYEVVP